ncbi:MAG TPA: tRNA pseudouridine(55) synthase TruB [Pyrinomonadaceae bacterium]|nr:tRNA pseudouridine(55) synthase TruB [Pyrinomonadaceae bacterium]
MEGILIIDKPAGITSHDVVARVRRILQTKRVGHTGTLDPFATGVMVILIGQATRLAQFLDKDEKEYEALVRFGFETDTGDKTGQMQNAECRMQNEEIEKLFAATTWDDVFVGFRGEIEQTPPMYSAKKVDGKKLYEHARKGETIERKSVTITIHELELLGDLRETDSGVGTWDLGLKVTCSAGTYIRTLAEDIGRKVGVGAHLAELRRTRVGKFGIDQSVTLEKLEQVEDKQTALIPMEEAVSHLTAFTLNPDRVGKTKSGMSTRVFDALFTVGQPIRMIDEDGKLIAIGAYDEAENSVRPKVVLV